MLRRCLGGGIWCPAARVHLRRDHLRRRLRRRGLALPLLLRCLPVLPVLPVLVGLHVAGVVWRSERRLGLGLRSRHPHQVFPSGVVGELPLGPTMLRRRGEAPVLLRGLLLRIPSLRAVLIGGRVVQGLRLGPIAEAALRGLEGICGLVPLLEWRLRRLALTGILALLGPLLLALALGNIRRLSQPLRARQHRLGLATGWRGQLP
mmetsp:Transcript_35504/g.111640  ORF Transcript_35504/g.111640 Transcript_35504/m.111640 type:complete len:205 (-) Transcript_35504:19-633(-)